MRNKSVSRTRRHGRKMYNMIGCSSFFHGKSHHSKSHHSKCHHKKTKTLKKRKSFRGGCGGTCPMTHSMIGGYLRKHSGAHQIRKKKNSKRNSNGESESSMASSSQHGGDSMTSDLIGAGRSIMYSAGSIYNAAGGYNAPVNPAPYADQFKSTFSKI